MYAVIKTGGKQYRVKQGDTLRVELLKVDPGSTISFDEVLMIGGDQPKIGKPNVEGAKVDAQVVQHGKGDKVLHFIKNYFGFTRRKGHRQQFTEVKITGISA